MAGRRKKDARAEAPLGGEERKRHQLLELGLKLFGGHSYAEVSIETIAKKAGISRGLLYHYFGGKRDFYTETVRYASTQLLSRLEPPMDLPQGERLRLGLDAYVDYAKRYALPYRVLYRGGLGVDATVTPILEATRDVIVDRILEGAGDRIPHDATSRAVIRAWIHFVEGATIDWIERGELTREQLVTLAAITLENFRDRALDELALKRSPH